VEGEIGVSPTVLAAEEVLDGRVRSPKLKRKPGGGGAILSPADVTFNSLREFRNDPWR